MIHLAEAPRCELRASFCESTIRVYQAFPPEIADGALRAQRFVAPFKRERMTWVKPSFTWMMYRSGWATKPGQERVLGIDLTRAGFEWALASACISHFEARMHGSVEEWRAMLRASAVRVQWDPERTLQLEELPWRTIQVGLGGEAVRRYVDEWIVRIEDVTPVAQSVGAMVRSGEVESAQQLVPVERAYPVPAEIARRIGASAAHPAESTPGPG